MKQVSVTQSHSLKTVGFFFLVNVADSPHCLTDAKPESNCREMKQQNSKGGRPVQVAEFESGQKAQNNFAKAMSAVLSAKKKPVKKRAA